jgi:hypothetical protein
MKVKIKKNRMKKNQANKVKSTKRKTLKRNSRLRNKESLKNLIMRKRENKNPNKRQKNPFSAHQFEQEKNGPSTRKGDREL